MEVRQEASAFRARLGMRLVYWSTLALVFLGAMIVVGATAATWKGEQRALMEASQLLLSALLPLFGTWVGTILAFYHKKENYEAASTHTLDLVRTVAQRLSSTKVADGSPMPTSLGSRRHERSCRNAD